MKHVAGHKRRNSELENEELVAAKCRTQTTVLCLADHFLQCNNNAAQMTVLNPHLMAYFRLLEDDVIQDFLWVDLCAKLADKYLLAMVYVYFRRASLLIDQYNRINFFIALYLANDMEEDDEDEKYKIFSWALGKDWATQFSSFLAQRDQLWKKMSFRASVSKKTCDEVMAMCPGHDLWQRQRLPFHGGAQRSHQRCAWRQLHPTCCKEQARQEHLSPTQKEALMHKLDLLDEIDSSYSVEEGGKVNAQSGTTEGVV